MQRYFNAARLLMLCLLVQSGLYAQRQIQPFIQPSSIEPYAIAVSEELSTSLIFPFSIKKAYWVSPSLDVQQVNGVDNILQVKARDSDLKETNLSVVTSDGRFYSFLIRYDEYPSVLNMRFVVDSTDVVATLSKTLYTDAQYQTISNSVLFGEPFLRKINTEQRMRVRLRGIYLQENSMWFSLGLTNQSRIAYTPESVRFFIRDKKRGKRTASQETEILPLFTTPVVAVKGLKKTSYAFAFTPLTLRRTQQLIIRFSEKSGGRTLSLRLRPQTLLTARALD